MGKTVAGVVLAGVVLWFWGFLFWGATNVPYASWKVPHDEAAAQQLVDELRARVAQAFTRGDGARGRERRFALKAARELHEPGDASTAMVSPA